MGGRHANIIRSAAPTHGSHLLRLACPVRLRARFVRGKKRAGFDLTIKLSWAGLGDAACITGATAPSEGKGPPGGVPQTGMPCAWSLNEQLVFRFCFRDAGTIELPSASADDLDDLHLEASLGEGGAAQGGAATALAAARELKQPLTRAMEEFFEELKTK